MILGRCNSLLARKGGLLILLELALSSKIFVIVPRRDQLFEKQKKALHFSYILELVEFHPCCSSLWCMELWLTCWYVLERRELGDIWSENCTHHCVA